MSPTDPTLPPVTVVFRGMTADELLPRATAMYAGGIRSFEVTTTGPDPTGTIAQLTRELPPDAVIGIGTVTDPAQVAPAADAGARYVVSPHFDPLIVETTLHAGLISAPGALTPTEVIGALRAGAHLVKIFPINAVGADYLRQLRGPLPALRVMASGGITPPLARELAAAGADGIALGTHLLGAGPGADPEVVTARSAEFVAIMAAR